MCVHPCVSTNHRNITEVSFTVTNTFKHVGGIHEEQWPYSPFVLFHCWERSRSLYVSLFVGRTRGYFTFTASRLIKLPASLFVVIMNTSLEYVTEVWNCYACSAFLESWTPKGLRAFKPPSAPQEVLMFSLSMSTCYRQLLTCLIWWLYHWSSFVFTSWVRVVHTFL